MWNHKAIISHIASCGLILSLAGGVAMSNDKPFEFGSQPTKTARTRTTSPLRVYAQIPNSGTSPTTQFRRLEQPLSIKVAVTAGGLALIGLQIWWFLLSKPKPQNNQVNK